ncbi:MAG: MFS transporter [Anaerolineae bacterium]|nr:MFS transporter [Anaerolineae bacterium]
MTRRSFYITWSRARQALDRLTLGGRWALSLSYEIHNNLRWYWFDGLLATASNNIVLTYLTVYILALGGTRAQIGLMSSLSSLSAAIMLALGALLAERIGHRKQITLIGGGGFARLMILLLAVIPLIGHSPAVIWIAVALAVTRDAFANLAFPSWVALTGDIVPIEGRGRYFGSRNFASGAAAMVTTLLIGVMITRAGEPVGYQIALILAFVLGIASTFCFSRINDTQEVTPLHIKVSFSLPSLLRGLGEHPAFIALCITAALWNFFLNIAGPFFSVYLVQKLGATAAMVGIVSVASSASGLIFQHKLGDLADRWGPRRLQMLSMLAIPILPLCWLLVTAAWQVILINLVSGLLWGAFNLASFNFLLTLTPDAQRARYSALYQIIVTVALSTGAAVGSVIVTNIGYHAAFIITGIGRFVAALLFVRLVRIPQDL